jgi:hypothetical protein
MIMELMSRDNGVKKVQGSKVQRLSLEPLNLEP